MKADHSRLSSVRLRMLWILLPCLQYICVRCYAQQCVYLYCFDLNEKKHGDCAKHVLPIGMLTELICILLMALLNNFTMVISSSEHEHLFHKLTQSGRYKIVLIETCKYCNNTFYYNICSNLTFCKYNVDHNFKRLN